VAWRRRTPPPSAPRGRGGRPEPAGSRALVLDRERLHLLAGDLDVLEPHEAADAVVHVHHVVARGELREALERDGASEAPAAAHAPRATEDLVVVEHAQRRVARLELEARCSVPMPRRVPGGMRLRLRGSPRGAASCPSLSQRRSVSFPVAVPARRYASSFCMSRSMGGGGAASSVGWGGGAVSDKTSRRGSAPRSARICSGGTKSASGAGGVAPDSTRLW
jgi:hypothetical protein